VLLDFHFASPPAVSSPTLSAAVKSLANAVFDLPSKMMELGVEEIIHPLRVTGFEVRKGQNNKKFVVYLLEYEVRPHHSYAPNTRFIITGALSVYRKQQPSGVPRL
jgi:hypothetical protein